jgi:hypothetical protein
MVPNPPAQSGLNKQNAVNSSGQNNSNAPSPDEWQDHFRGFDSCEFVKLCLDRATRGISCLPQERDADPIAILRPKNSPIGKPGRRKQQKKLLQMQALDRSG